MMLRIGEKKIHKLEKLFYDFCYYIFGYSLA